MSTSFKENDELIAEFEKCLNNISDPKQLHIIKNIFFKKNIKPLFENLKHEALLEKRRKIGLSCNELSSQLNQIFEKRLKLITNLKMYNDDKTEYDVNLPNVDLSSGNIHPLNIVINDVLNFFQKFNFDVYISEELTSTEFSFDILNIPLSHITRSFDESLYIDSHYNNNLLRPHCTASTVKFIQASRSKEIRVVTFGNVYRNDTEDSTHGIQFKQIDFMWIRKDLSLANLKWIINELIQYLFGSTQTTRFRISQFYFTEPSLEVDIGCLNCQNGCSFCNYSQWIEILGCGMLHENVIKSSKLKEPNMSGLAGGLGVERITMLKYGLRNIQDLYKNNLEFLKAFKKK